MNKITRRVSCFFLLFFLFMTETFAVTEPSLNLNEKPFFNIIAEESQIKRLSSGDYQITLSSVSSIHYVANAPSKTVGKVSTEKFASLWKETTFKSNPPKAIFAATAQVANTKAHSIYLLVIQNATYHAEQKQLIFEVTVIEGGALQEGIQRNVIMIVVS